MFDDTFQQNFYHQIVDPTSMCYAMNLYSNEIKVDPCPCIDLGDLRTLVHFRPTLNSVQIRLWLKFLQQEN